ncbi:MAG: CBS domain-containing protein [Methanosarcinales archaeon]|nr:CBS domain-containing protein [Methanosarcinales archaeon]
MPIIAVCPEDSILKAAKRIRINGVRSIVVTDEKMKGLKGIVSRGDIVKCVEIIEDTTYIPQVYFENKSFS